MFSKSDTSNQQGVVLIELAFVLPVMLLLAFGMVTIANYLNQSFREEQTAYNAALLAAYQEGGVSQSAREALISNAVDTLTTAHKVDGIEMFMHTLEAPEIDAYDPTNPATTYPMNSVAVRGTTRQLIGTFHDYHAPVLIGSEEVSASPFFASSGVGSSPNCCGGYGSSSSRCIKYSWSRGAIFTYENCSPSDIGYVDQ